MLRKVGQAFRAFLAVRRGTWGEAVDWCIHGVTDLSESLSKG